MRLVATPLRRLFSRAHHRLTAAMACTLWLAAAHAQYNPTPPPPETNLAHTNNTPYLLQGPDGWCMTAGPASPVGFNRAYRQPCNPSDERQVLYLLQVDNDGDITRPSATNPSVQARIVKARNFDQFLPGYGERPAYWMANVLKFPTVGISHYVGFDSYYTNGALPEPRAIFTLSVPAAEITPPQWTLVAAEGATFPLYGRRKVRFGSGSNWVTKVIQSTSMPFPQGSCTVAFFGSDPAPGAKQCEIADDQAADGAFEVELRVLGQCVFADDEASNLLVYNIQYCPPNPVGKWRLIPVNYPVR